MGFASGRFPSGFYIKISYVVVAMGVVWHAHLILLSH